MLSVEMLKFPKVEGIKDVTGCVVPAICCRRHSCVCVCPYYIRQTLSQSKLIKCPIWDGQNPAWNMEKICKQSVNLEIVISRRTKERKSNRGLQLRMRTCVHGFLSWASFQGLKTLAIISATPCRQFVCMLGHIINYISSLSVSLMITRGIKTVSVWNNI